MGLATTHTYAQMPGVATVQSITTDRTADSQLASTRDITVYDTRLTISEDPQIKMLINNRARAILVCTVNLSDGDAPGRVQMRVATPTERHWSAASLAAAATSCKLSPSAAAAPAICSSICHMSHATCIMQ